MRRGLLFVFMIIMASLWLGARGVAHPPQAKMSVSEDIREGSEALQRNDFEGAERYFLKALEADPNLAEVRSNLGLAYYGSRKYVQAVEAFRAALKQDSSLPTSRAFLPLSLAAMGQCREAVSGLRREFSTNPDDKLRRIIGLSFERCLIEGGQLAEANTVMQQLLAHYPDDADVLYEGGQMYARVSSSLYLHLLEVAPHSARAYQTTGEVAASEGNWQGAIDSFQKALGANPALPGLHLQIAILLLEHSTQPDGWKQALEELKAELKIDPASAQAYYQIAKAHRKHMQVSEATSAYQKALELDPNFVEARLALANILRQEKRPGEAAAILEPARETAPDNAAVHYLLAQLYRELGRTVEADREQTAFEQLKPKSQ